MTNPGYVCKRKRKRDLIVLGALFGNTTQGGQTIEMTGLGLFAGLGSNPSDLKNPISNQQDPIYQDGAQASNNNAANPLAAIFSSSKSPTNVNARNLNLPMSSPKQNSFPNGQQVPQSSPMGNMVPGLASIV